MKLYLEEIERKNAGDYHLLIGGYKFYFPALPASIRVNSAAKTLSYDLIGKGTVVIPKGWEPESITWSGIFYGMPKRKEQKGQKYTSPAECREILTDWMKKGNLLRLVATGTGINYDVIIQSFEWEANGAFGNLDYTISCIRNRPLNIYTTNELGIQKFVEERPQPPPPQTYVVVSGDNLWKIARMFYGGTGSDWNRIYDANAAVIEETARQYGKSSSDNGHWIYPGTEFVIP